MDIKKEQNLKPEDLKGATDGREGRYKARQKTD